MDKWTRTEKLTMVGVMLAFMSLPAFWLVVPEFRAFLSGWVGTSTAVGEVATDGTPRKTAAGAGAAAQTTGLPAHDPVLKRGDFVFEARGCKAGRTGLPPTLRQQGPFLTDCEVTVTNGSEADAHLYLNCNGSVAVDGTGVEYRFRSCEFGVKMAAGYYEQVLIPHTPYRAVFHLVSSSPLRELAALNAVFYGDGTPMFAAVPFRHLRVNP